jgi:hypothetical protein
MWTETPGEEHSWGKQFVNLVQHPELYETWSFKEVISWLGSYHILVAFEDHEEDMMVQMLQRFERGIPALASGANTNGAKVDWELFKSFRKAGGKLFHCLCGDFKGRACCVHVLSHLTHKRILTVPIVFSGQRLHSGQALYGGGSHVTIPALACPVSVT